MALTLQTTSPANPAMGGGAAPTPANPATGGGAGHNSGNAQAAQDASLNAWLDQCRAFGELQGAGETSAVGWMQDMVQRAYRGDILPDHAEKGAMEYQMARRKRAAMLGTRVGAGAGKADKIRASEAKRMIRLGGLAQFRNKNNGGLGTFNKALKVIGSDPDLRGEVGKMLLKVASEQLRKPDAPLDDDYIRQILSPKEGDEKKEGAYLVQAKKAIDLAARASTWDAHKRAALSSINARIEQIGFKTAAERVKEEKAKAQQRKEKLEAQRVARATAGASQKGKAAVAAVNGRKDGTTATA